MFHAKKFLLPIFVLLSAGCMVTSLNPIFTDKDLVYWTNLVGTWQGDKEGDTITIAGSPETKEYAIKMSSEGQSLDLTGHLCEINSKTYIDIVLSNLPDEKQFPGVPLVTPIHVFYMIEVQGDSLRLRSMSTDWIKNRRDKGHLWIANRADGDSTLLTADTARVQRFLRRWGNAKDAWGDWSEAKRLPAAK